VVLSAARAYRDAMRDFAAMGNLGVWYARLDVDRILTELAKVAPSRDLKEAR
jgi:hypothetical protein